MRRLLCSSHHQIRVRDLSLSLIPISDYPVDCEIKTAGIAESAITLGENEYFLLGDNPDNSQDSSFQAVGNVQKS